MRSNLIICKLEKMSGCFMAETQKGLRIITTYLFSPLQYTILLIFSGNSEEVERKSKRATVQAHSGINNYSSVSSFCRWLYLSIEFAYSISFSLDWKIIHRISANRRQVYFIYRYGLIFQASQAIYEHNIYLYPCSYIKVIS